MSYNVDKDLQEILGADNDVAEYNRKKMAVEKANMDMRFQQLEDQKEEMSRLETFDLSYNSAEAIDQLAKDTTDYLRKAKKSKVFLNDAFRGKVPFFARNIILAVAETGRGKSTITANLTFNASIQDLKVLVLSNEENAGDVYNRITCLPRGWSYTNQENFTEEMIAIFDSMMRVLSEKITVIGDTHRGVTGCTTTIEGIERILNTLIQNKHLYQYDLIILDYYQNVDRSVKNQNLNEYQVQYKLSKLLDQFKNVYDAPIVVLAQKKPSSKGKELSFKDSIEGRKTIMNVATCVLDINIDADRLVTTFRIEKSRFNGCLGQTVEVGFDRGRYVDYTPAFKLEVDMRASQKKTAELLSHVKTTNSNGG